MDPTDAWTTCACELKVTSGTCARAEASRVRVYARRQAPVDQSRTFHATCRHNYCQNDANDCASVCSCLSHSPAGARSVPPPITEGHQPCTLTNSHLSPPPTPLPRGSLPCTRIRHAEERAGGAACKASLGACIQRVAAARSPSRRLGSAAAWFRGGVHCCSTAAAGGRVSSGKGAHQPGRPGVRGRLRRRWLQRLATSRP